MPQQTAAVAGAPVPGFNAQELLLRALQQRRELLTEQYETAMRSRGQLGQERLNAQARGDASMVREYEGAVERLGTRMQEIERSIAGVDRQIDEAMKSIGPVESLERLEQLEALEPMTASVISPAASQLLAAQRVEFQRMMVAEGAVFAILAALLWRFGVARGRRQAMRAEAPRDDRKLQESIDAIAIEVERLSEGQRFVNNLMSARRADRDALPVQPPPLSAPGESSWITPH